MAIMRVTLSAGERLLINGAVLRANRKIALELLNEADFLLEQHVLSPIEVLTPIHFVYFSIQTMLKCPRSSRSAFDMCQRSIASLRRLDESQDLQVCLTQVSAEIDRERYIYALKAIRNFWKNSASRPAPPLAALAPGSIA